MVKCRKQMRKVRQVILLEIDKLDELRCESCMSDNGLAELNRTNCGCEAAVKIRDLGAKLGGVIAKRKKLDVEVAEVPGTTGMTFDELTTELYQKMKGANLRDSDIRKTFSVGMRKFISWKDANGLSKKTMEAERKQGGI